MDSYHLLLSGKPKRIHGNCAIGGACSTIPDGLLMAPQARPRRVIRPSSLLSETGTVDMLFNHSPRCVDAG